MWINAYGRADSRGLFQSVSREDYFRYITYLAEQNFRHTEELQRINDSKNISTIVRETAIIDLEHLSMYQLSYKPGESSFSVYLKMSVLKTVIDISLFA